MAIAQDPQIVELTRGQLPAPMPSRSDSGGKTQNAFILTQVPTPAMTPTPAHQRTSAAAPILRYNDMKELRGGSSKRGRGQGRGRPRGRGRGDRQISPRLSEPEQSSTVRCDPPQSNFLRKAIKQKKKLPTVTPLDGAMEMTKKYTSTDGVVYEQPGDQRDVPANDEWCQGVWEAPYHSQPQDPAAAQAPRAGGDNAVASPVSRKPAFIRANRGTGFSVSAQALQKIGQLNGTTSYPPLDSTPFVGPPHFSSFPQYTPQSQYQQSSYGFSNNSGFFQNRQSSLPLTFNPYNSAVLLPIDPALIADSNNTSRIYNAPYRVNAWRPRSFAQNMLVNIPSSRRNGNTQLKPFLPNDSTLAVTDARRARGQEVEQDLRASNQCHASFHDPLAGLGDLGFDPFADVVGQENGSYPFWLHQNNHDAGHVECGVIDDLMTQNTVQSSMTQAKAAAANTQGTRKGEAEGDSTRAAPGTPYQAIVDDADYFFPEFVGGDFEPRRSFDALASRYVASRGKSQYRSPTQSQVEASAPHSPISENFHDATADVSPEYCYNFALGQVAKTSLEHGSPYDIDIPEFCLRAINEREAMDIRRMVCKADRVALVVVRVDGKAVMRFHEERQLKPSDDAVVVTLVKKKRNYGSMALKHTDGVFVKETTWDCLLKEAVHAARERKAHQEDREYDTKIKLSLVRLEHRARHAWRGDYVENMNIDDSQLRKDFSLMLGTDNSSENEDDRVRQGRLAARVRLKRTENVEVGSQWLTADEMRKLTKSAEEVRSRPFRVELVETDDIRFPEVNGIRMRTKMTMRFALFWEPASQAQGYADEMIPE